MHTMSTGFNELRKCSSITHIHSTTASFQKCVCLCVWVCVWWGRESARKLKTDYWVSLEKCLKCSLSADGIWKEFVTDGEAGIVNASQLQGSIFKVPFTSGPHRALSKVYFGLGPSVQGIGSGSTATITQIMWLLEINNWNYKRNK